MSVAGLIRLHWETEVVMAEQEVGEEEEAEGEAPMNRKIQLGEEVEVGVGEQE